MSKQGRATYRELFRYQLDPVLVDQISSATTGNYALGNERFLAEMAAALGRRVTLGQAGRPRVEAEVKSEDLFG